MQNPQIFSFTSEQIAYNLNSSILLELIMGYFRENVEQAAGYEPGFQPKETDVVKLNTNENPYPPSPAVMNVLAEIDPEKLRRYPDPVGQQFREAAAQVNDVSPELPFVPSVTRLDPSPIRSPRIRSIRFWQSCRIARRLRFPLTVSLICRPNWPEPAQL
jgi:hypothetical protein